MNRHDIKRTIETSELCRKLKDIVETKLDEKQRGNVKLESYVESFLISPTLIYIREFWKALGEFKRMTIG